jgi:uncharacterized membrane protein
VRSFVTKYAGAVNTYRGRVLLVACGVFALFLLSAPWHVGTREVGRVSVGLALALTTLLLLLAARPDEARAAWEGLLRGEFRASRLAVTIFAVACFVFLLRICVAHFLALNVNAWDFSIYFDRPLERTVHGDFLYSDFLGRSTLSAHADFILLAFVPLYAVHATPYWLVGGQAVAVTLGAVCGFAVFRSILNDDVAAFALAGAFVLNRYTAKAVQYVFHFEVFYPAVLFLLIWAFLTRHNGIVIIATILAILIKQDAVLALAGCAMLFLVVYRRPRIAAAVLSLAIAGFTIDYFLIMPHFAGSAHPWYAWYWLAYGPSPLGAATAMAAHPVRVVKDVMRSDVPQLILTLLATPIVGLEWLLAAFPIIAIDATAAVPKLRELDLYYSTPLLALMFTGAAVGIRRMSTFIHCLWSFETRMTQRMIACSLLLVCAFAGAGYTIAARRPEVSGVEPLLNRVPPRTPILIQSALFPHAGYEVDGRVITDSVIDPRSAYMLAAHANAYPLNGLQLRNLRNGLAASGRFILLSERGVDLFLPKR